MLRTQKICIVDGYSSGNFLAPEFRRRGFSVIHVQSTPEIYSVLKPSFKPQDYDAHLILDDGVEKLLRELRNYQLSAVLAGTETGVELADELTAALNLPGNGTERSAARRHKYLMIETMREAGLKVARQTRGKDPEDLCRWLVESGLSKVVVKPVASAGAEDVRICASEAEVRAAVAKTIGKINMLGLRNDEVVMQELLVGKEYFINSVSFEGRHHISDIWRHEKRPLNGFDFVYDCAELCSAEETQGIAAYVHQVLDALQVRFGPAHAEVMVTDKGPHLIEIGTRLQGMTVPALNDAAIGYGPVELTVDAAVDVNAFRKKAELPYQRRQHALRVNLISSVDGVLKSRLPDAEFQELKSFFSLRWIKEPGMKVVPTTNYFTVAGFVCLVHPDEAVVWEDYRRIRNFEAQGKVLQLE